MQALHDAVVEGAKLGQGTSVEVISKAAFDADAGNVLVADAIIIGTTENFGYMSGGIKDFFERIYYPVLEQKQGLPAAVFIKGGHDGTGARKSIEPILTGLRWKQVQEPVVMRGEFQPQWIEDMRDLGAAMAAGLSLGVF